MPSLRASLASIFVCLSLVITADVRAQDAPETHEVEGSGGAWRTEIRNARFNRAADARVAPYLGRDDALWLRANTHTLRMGAPFEDFVDGTIEFDVVPFDRANFVGVMFRRAAYDDQENLYLRPHKSGKFDAVQYAPRINGSTWQIYPQFNRETEWPTDRWTHVRIEVTGSRMELYVGDARGEDSGEPTLVVPRLRADARRGGIGFWARINFDNDSYAAAISRLEVRPRPLVAPAEAPAAPAPGVLRHWQIAGPIEAGDEPIMVLPDRDDWRGVAVEEDGLLNLNRHVGRAGRGRFTVLARTTLVAERSGPVPLDVGYSDDLVVFLNGRPLYAGRNGWEARYPGFLGQLARGHETVVLDLRTGRNELVLAVTDDQRFGWGLSAAVPEEVAEAAVE